MKGTMLALEPDESVYREHCGKCGAFLKSKLVGDNPSNHRIESEPCQRCIRKAEASHRLTEGVRG